MIYVLFVTVAALLIALGGLFAATDAAILSLSRADILELADRHRAKRSLRAIAADTSSHVNAINFGRVVSETTAAVLVTIVLATVMPNILWALLLSVLIMTAVSFVLVGSSPRSVGRMNPRPLVAFTAPLVHSLRVVLGPVAGALVALGNRVTPGRAGSASFSSEQQLLSMVDEATELEVLEEEDRELIHSIIEFNDTVVREVMVPRTDMVTVDESATVGQGMGLFLSTGVSRMPVVADDNVDEIRGILYLRDVARLTHERPKKVDVVTVITLARPALFVPESKKVDDTLRQMQLDSNHLAMVVDEYGGIAGLVTMEDLIEELVGEISDEYDRDSAEVEQIADGVFRVSARLAIDELGELFDLELDDDDVDTVGGLLSKQLGRLATTGSSASAFGLLLTAEQIDGRRKRISIVLVQRDEEAEAAPGTEMGT